MCKVWLKCAIAVITVNFTTSTVNGNSRKYFDKVSIIRSSKTNDWQIHTEIAHWDGARGITLFSVRITTKVLLKLPFQWETNAIT